MNWRLGRTILSLVSWLIWTTCTDVVKFTTVTAQSETRSWTWPSWLEFSRKLVNGNFEFELGEGNWYTTRLGLIQHVTPTPTLTSTVANALGVAGLGFLLTKELAVALNTPVLIPFMLVVHLSMSILALLLPNVGSLLGI